MAAPVDSTLGFMKYADLIERALTEVKGSDVSLATLLGGVDALNHSVPSLDELNEAFREVEKRGRFASCDWRHVDQATYEKAITENWERMTRFLESQGMSREQQQKALEWHRKIWGKT